MSCTCRKVIFISRAEAQAAVRKHRVTGDQRPYVCPGDPFLWHLTSHARTKNKRSRREKSA